MVLPMIDAQAQIATTDRATAAAIAVPTSRSR